MDNNNEINVIKEAFQRLISIKKEEIDLIYKIKTLEEDIKFDYASSKQFKKKDESIDTNRVKIALVKDAIKISLMEEKNRLEEKYNLLCEYIDDIENGNFNMDLINSYVNKIEEINSLKDDMKYTKNEYNGIIENDVMKKINKLVSIVSKKYKEKKDREWKDSIGKPVKNKEVINESDIIELAKMLGIEI